MNPPPRVAILTVSDRCSRGESLDNSGPALAAMVREQLGGEVVAEQIVPDEIDRIRRVVWTWATGEDRPDLLLTTGGTGLAERDVTPEAVRPLLDKDWPGLMELSRARCAVETPLAYLSRGIAGSIGRTLVLTLPGSPRGAAESLAAVLDILPHAMGVLRGEPSCHACTPGKGPGEALG